MQRAALLLMSVGIALVLFAYAVLSYLTRKDIEAKRAATEAARSNNPKNNPKLRTSLKEQINGTSENVHEQNEENG